MSAPAVWTRRSFLAALAAFTAACASDGETSGGGGPAADADQRPIVVVGAGMAGLAAARALTDSGHEVVVVEARDRIGGRTWTADVGPARVDLGGAWIHGPNGNPIAEAARDAGLTFDEQPDELERVHDLVRDEPLSTPIGWQLFGQVDEFYAFVEDRDGDWDASDSAADLLDAFFAEADLGADEARRLRVVLETLLGDASAPMDRLSARGLLDSEDTEYGGRDHVIGGGYGALVDELATGVEVRTSRAVGAIVYDGDGVTVSTDSGDIDASHAIVTVPLGALKAGAIEFDPPLPDGKTSAIERLGFGAFEKVVLVYEERWWTDVFETSAAALALPGPERAFPYWFDMTAFAGAPTLVTIYSGAFAGLMQELDEPRIVEEAMEVLGTLTGESPAPVAATATRWQHDPLALGSYSYLAVGSTPDDQRALAEPVDGRLLFAGEATIAEAFQTVHGAFMSGLREAQRIDPTAAIDFS